MNPAIALSLKWPRWYPTSAADRQLDATTLETLINSGLISRTSAIKAIADTYDIDNVSTELEQIVRLIKMKGKQLTEPLSETGYPRIRLKASRLDLKSWSATVEKTAV